MLEDEEIFSELENLINQKKKRYSRALAEEEESSRILTRVTQLEDSLIDAYLKYIRMKYWVRANKVGIGTDIDEEYNEFTSLVGEEDIGEEAVS